VRFDSNEILSILSLLTHRRTKLIAWTYPGVLTGTFAHENDLKLYGDVKWDDGISSDFEKILRLPEEKRTIIIRAITIYSQAINFYTMDITLGILFLCIAIEVLASYKYFGKGIGPKKRFVNFIMEFIPSVRKETLSEEYNFNSDCEFKKYLEDIYNKYRSDFVHEGRNYAADNAGYKFTKEYVNSSLFENIVWHTIKNYIKTILQN
jgi:hypothetical protein